MSATVSGIAPRTQFAVERSRGRALRWAKDDLKNDRLPVVITAPDAESLKKMKELVAQFGTVGEDLELINGFAAEVDPEKLKDFFKNVPENVNVTLDQKIGVPKPVGRGKYTGQVHPKLDRTMRLLNMEKLWEKGLTGNGIGIAVLDTGVYPHKDLRGRIVAFKDVVDDNDEPRDGFGHGTHVSGIIAGNGRASCAKYTGMAPDADIIGVKVLSDMGSGSVAGIVQGIQWAIDNKDKYNIRVMNLSLGGYAFNQAKDDPLVQALEKATDAGIVVAVAAGNEGPGKETIGSPAIAPDVITVGAYDDKNTPEKDDDDMADFSSRGPSIDGYLKPEVAAPGVNITSAIAPGSVLDDPSIPHVGAEYITISGTSMATPMVAGLAALLAQANPNAKPFQIKRAIVATADAMNGKSVYGTGAGLINPEAAVQYITNVFARSASLFPVPELPAAELGKAS